MKSLSSRDIAFARRQTVHSTISQDFAQGKLAREAAALQSLGAKVSTAQIPTAEAESKSAQQIPAPPSQPANLRALSPRELREQQLRENIGGNPKLEDYQMRLILLEQKNKKRLMMARQEQLECRAPHQARNSESNYTTASRNHSKSGNCLARKGGLCDYGET